MDPAARDRYVFAAMPQSPFTYRDNATVLIVGVGLMGRHMAAHAADWLTLKKLILVDAGETVRVGDQILSLADFAASLSESSGGDWEAVAETVDITDEAATAALFERHQGVDYWLHTVGVSPKPLTPPERMDKEDVMTCCEVNLWGAHNVLKQAINGGAFRRGARGVMILSTSATVGSEGRASSAYEESKGGLMNLLRLQSRYFAEHHGLILNGLAPSPLRGPMAAQNPVSAGRLQAVEDATPLGGLTNPSHISAAALYFWAEECWSVGEILTVDGGYTKHRPIYGPLTT